MRFLLVLGTALVVAGAAGWAMKRLARTEGARAAADAFLARVRGWWVLSGVFVAATAVGPIGSLVVFGLTSFLLLRELATITPTRKADHPALAWLFFVILPLQYVLLGADWYGLFTILIPVYAFLFLPIRMAVTGDPERFLERTAKLQWALMIGVYCVSHVPALLRLSVPGCDGAGPRLLLFLCVAVQGADAAHDLVDRVAGRRLVAPHLTDRRSWEGLAAALATSAGVGALLAWATPFSRAQAVGMALLAALLGAAGHLCLTAIKRDRGREGVVVVHRAGMMDRVFSLCFAAPVFFHLTRFYFTPGAPNAF